MSACGILVNFDPEPPARHSCASTSANRHGRSLGITLMSRIMAIVRVKRDLPYSRSIELAKKLLSSFKRAKPAAMINCKK